jgi:hypothetical protein
VLAQKGVAAAAGRLVGGWLREPAQQALLGLMVHAGRELQAVGIYGCIVCGVCHAARHP